MNDAADKALLPAGLADRLPPEADHEEALTRCLLDRFASYGYRRVKPPMLEFETGLFDGVGATVADQTFRIMDPVSQRMMGLRADITPQIARIAATRLAAEPRPLRLSYSGEVLRVRGTQLRTERQFRQIGVELIGAASAATGDAEVILLAAEGLGDIAVAGLSVDVNVPSLARTLIAALGVAAPLARRLLAAVDRKDAAGLDELAAGQGGLPSPPCGPKPPAFAKPASTLRSGSGAAAAAEDGPAGEGRSGDGPKRGRLGFAQAGEAARLLAKLVDAAGPAEAGIPALARLELPQAAAELVQRLAEVVALVRAAAPGLSLTVDAVESRGFEYHTGVSFTLFALGVRGELGSGGRYRTASGEPATGFTLFTDTLLRAAPAPEPRRRLLLPHGAPAEVARRLRADGWVVVQGLVATGDDAAEARRLGCGHLWRAGDIAAVARG